MKRSLLRLTLPGLKCVRVTGWAGLLLMATLGCRALPPPAPSPAGADVVRARVRSEQVAASMPTRAGASLADHHESWQADEQTAAVRDASNVQPVSYDPPVNLPRQAWTGGPGLPADACPSCPTDDCDPSADGYWQPDGLQGPWPYDEYLFDGGDRDVPVKVDPNWNVRGLDLEDTVAHYDTRDGRLEVVPSNRVPIYAPRFAAVRRVDGLEYNQGQERLAGVELPTRINSQEATRIVTTAIQPTQPVLQHGFRTSVALREQTRGLGIDNAQLLLGLDSNFLPHEDFRIIRRGEFDGTEKPRLAERTQAALTWSSDQMVQVVLDGKPAYESVNSSTPQETREYHMPPGKPRLRIVKVASKSEARPGEIIDFTLRFDNVGDQHIGNVTIVDNLTTRLEYVEGSAQCSLPGRFGTQVNDGESLVLRWEITDPLDVGKGGVIRFQCRLK